MINGNAYGNPFLSAGAVAGEDTTVPILLIANVGDVSPDKVTLTYNEGLDTGSVPATGAYSLSGTSETISSVAVAGSVVTLTLSGNIIRNETILVSYTAGANPVRDVAENNAANLTNQAVTNTTGDYLADHDGDYILDHDGNKIPI